jgi:Alpha-mannosidase
MTPIPAHYISGTHWDREWYRPFQEFRFLLVSLVDELLETMETNPDFRFFQLDGQTCILDDYLEIRPENRTRLEALIRDGRLLIGPWFTMPDLFCVGQEALIRNLLLGATICREWNTEPMPVGFVCDMFGHPSQLPQILAGFGYRDCVLGRGTNESTTPPFFTWEAPDGSQVLVFKLQDANGYGAFALPRATVEKRKLFIMQTMKEFVRELNGAAGDPAREREVRQRHFRKEISAYVRHEISRGGPVLCLMDSMDHIPPASEVGGYLAMLHEACPEIRAEHSSLPRFFAEARTLLKDPPVRRGELREPSRQRSEYLWLIPNCPSARVGLKLANDACQNLLERWADPLTAIANLEGASIPRRHLRVAWKYLLLNHAHDSICGCSIDQVHRDMMYRFDQCRVLAEQLRAQAIGHLTASSTELARHPGEFTLTLVNPLPEARNEVEVFAVDLPPDYPAEFRESFFSHPLKAFTLETADGEPVPYQRLEQIPLTNERSRHAQYCFQSDGPFTRVRVAARVPLPGLGFTSLRVVPSPTPVRSHGSLRTGPLSAANEFLEIRPGPGGTLALRDKRSGEEYRDLFQLEDRSETGDGWFHVHSPNDTLILSGLSEAQAEVVHDGPSLVGFRARVQLRLPSRYDGHRQTPLEHRTPLEVQIDYILRAGAPAVDVDVRVGNTCRDHRLRLLLPTDCPEASTYLAHQAFDFVERPVPIDPQTADWQESEIAEKPFLDIQAVQAGQRGLALLSAGGVHEGGVADDRRRTMHFTLLRAFRQTIATGGEEGGQELGVRRFRFRLLPFSGRFPRSEALAQLARLQTGIFTRQTGPRPSGFPPMEGNQPATRGFLEALTGTLPVSAIKAPESGPGLVVRLWNPHPHEARETLRFHRPVTAVSPLDLAERPAASCRAEIRNRHEVTITAAPHAIVTVRVELDTSRRDFPSRPTSNHLDTFFNSRLD